jgi:peroxiredoxin (alkyl hydroperoxide reductase subunit C)
MTLIGKPVPDWTASAHAVSTAFGVLDKDLGIAFRATVIVDHESIVRSVAVNDLNAGRSPAEGLRTVQALKTGELCGADWRKGDRYAA